MTSLHYKNILLWRHADAEIARIGQDDVSRALTTKGVTQAKEMAKWLNKKMPSQAAVFSSPALRALQTVEHLKHKYNTSEELHPNSSLKDTLKMMERYDDFESILLVGHQPILGSLAANLLGLNSQDFSIKKGAVWWLRLGSREVGKYQLYTIQTPQLL
jgi:phosphohistidine phosphatase